MTSAIVCENLVKTYEDGKRSVEALRGLELEVPRGECFGLLGPNGAGKTTTVEILQGLIEPTSGEVQVLGLRWGAGNDSELREKLGSTLQETRLQDKLTVIETLQLFRSFYRIGITPQQALHLVDLEEKSSALVRTLSGGQKQRLAVACGLVGKPELLFLDEPTTGLDPTARRRLWDVVTALKATGTTILLTTHYMDEAEKLSDRVAIVDQGKIIALGTPRQLIHQLGGEHVVEFSLQQNGQRRDDLPPDHFTRVATVHSATREPDGYLLTVAEPHLAIPSLLQQLAAEQLELASLTTRHVNLEDVFITLTGKRLTEEEDN
ncbi:MAG: Daunorubicin/doxorubicin resistance ATP-binding protein DrrA [Phycisphaerae bacterium]|nr:Daunorubicin/doxorubicin resistance ATP-binding protein DrrA [Phycisphaerae bacterium]